MLAADIQGTGEEWAVSKVNSLRLKKFAHHNVKLQKPWSHDEIEAVNGDVLCYNEQVF